MSLIKKLFFYAIIIFINIFLFEGISHLYLKFLKLDRVENFNMWEFTERVNDERFITLKKNYIYKFNNEATWNVETNDLRTRIPPSYTDNNSINKPVFLFIGDSVPFGWGTSAENSMPYILSKKLQSYQIINGAIPSYSLLQTIKRFEYEFRNINTIEYIYVQIYDPVSQYALGGSNWKEGDNWSTFSDKRFNGCRFSDSELYSWFYKHSKFVYLANKIYRDRMRCWEYLPPNETSDLRLKNHIEQQLYLLNKLKNKNTKVIVAPVTPSIQGLADFNKEYAESLMKVNKTLRSVSNELGFMFVDTQEILDKQDDFVDRCCHLSRAGAEKIVNQILNLIDKNQL